MSARAKSNRPCRSPLAELALQVVRSVLLHGDLTPVNVLDGGERGLVAIDPAPCVGDPAFDLVDLVFWRAGDVATIEQRAAELAHGIGADPGRTRAWCAAFAGMVALEIAEKSETVPPLANALRDLAASA